jgi:mobilization protein NikA
VVKPPLRTKTLGTKVSEEEFAQLEAAASERGLTLSEWCREKLLASVNGQEEKSAADLSPVMASAIASANGTGQALMAELVALRAILLNVLFKLANGQAVTAEEMQRLIDRADSDKLKKARERLEQASDSKEG